jgi:hypothetical protein
MSSTQIDPRGPRFGAALTSVVLAAVLLLSTAPALAATVLAVQSVVFALGSRGRSPYVRLYARYVRPRLGPPTELEDPRPPQFALNAAIGLCLGCEAYLFYKRVTNPKGATA